MLGSLAERTILIIEDDDGIARLLHDCLADEGGGIFTASSAADALAQFEAGLRPDAIVLDFLLPADDGLEFYGQLRNRGFDIPTLLLSAWPHVEAIATEINVPFMKKPFDVDALVEVLAQLVSDGTSVTRTPAQDVSGTIH